MPLFDVEAVEKFTVRTWYQSVEAPTAAAAEALCKKGDVAYDGKEILEGGEEWLETTSVVPHQEGI